MVFITRFPKLQLPLKFLTPSTRSLYIRNVYLTFMSRPGRQINLLCMSFLHVHVYMYSLCLSCAFSRLLFVTTYSYVTTSFLILQKLQVRFFTAFLHWMKNAMNSSQRSSVVYGELSQISVMKCFCESRYRHLAFNNCRKNSLSQTFDRVPNTLLASRIFFETTNKTL